jgi:hypothetical protein
MVESVGHFKIAHIVKQSVVFFSGKWKTVKGERGSLCILFKYNNCLYGYSELFLTSQSSTIKITFDCCCQPFLSPSIASSVVTALSHVSSSVWQHWALDFAFIPSQQQMEITFLKLNIVPLQSN